MSRFRYKVGDVPALFPLQAYIVSCQKNGFHAQHRLDNPDAGH